MAAPTSTCSTGVLSGLQKLGELPTIIGVRDARYQVVFRQSVLDEIHAAGPDLHEAEVCGVIVGMFTLTAWPHGHTPSTAFAATMPSVSRPRSPSPRKPGRAFTKPWKKNIPARKSSAGITPTPASGSSCPAWTCSFRTIFSTSPGRSRLSTTTQSGDGEGTFIWRGGKSVRESVLVENDSGAPPSQQCCARPRNPMKLPRRRCRRVTAWNAGSSISY